jgi:hypothetical protein
LHFLPALENSILFENFASWDPSLLLRDAACVAQNSGVWRLGPGTEVPPRIQRVPSGRGPCGSFAMHTVPISPWCVRLVNDDPLTDYGPSGLVFKFGNGPLRPSFFAFRCRATASKPHRAGAAVALSRGLGNDKGPEDVAVFINFTRDGDGRHVVAPSQSQHWPIGQWHEGEWVDVRIKLDWEKQCNHIQITCDGEVAQKVQTVPFKHPTCGTVNYLLLYNQTRDFEACWTDLLIL